MSGPEYLDLLRRIWPEVIVALGALAVLFAGGGGWGGVPPATRRRANATLGTVVLLTAAGFVARVPSSGGWGDGMVVTEPGLGWVKLAILLLAAACLWLGDDRRGGGEDRHGAEFTALLLLSTTGLLLVTGSAHLLLIFLGLELASLPLYALAGFDRGRRESADAALRYFLVGSVAAAVMLYGISLLHGVAGTLDLRLLPSRLTGAGAGPVAGVGMVCVLAGLGFKVAAAPFHFWVADVYAGAPRAVSALVASGSKVAGFLVLARILQVGLAGHEGSAAWGRFAPGWLPVLAVIATASVAVGNLTALSQTRFRRLLAWSAVAHSGYALVALVSRGADARPAVIYYAVTYAVSLVGLFALARILERDRGGDAVAGWAGLSRRSPWIAAALAVQMLSLAGVPPAAGFMGKFFAFSAALQGPGGTGNLWLVLVALGFSCVGIFYYLRVLHAAFGDAPDGSPGPLPVERADAVVVAVSSVLVVALGVWPEPLLAVLRPVAPF